MRETFGVPPVVPPEQRPRSRVPLWAWLFTALGVAFMVTAAVVVERAVHLERSASRQRTVGPVSPSSAADTCRAAAKRLEQLASAARRCADDETANSLLAGRSQVILAVETAHDDASRAEVRDACETVLLDLPDFVCP